MKIKQSKKKKLALYALGISTFFVAFNNAGQFLTFLNVPFTKTGQIYIGLICIGISLLWYSYLEGAIK
jgi:hypothetical protein